MKTFILTAEAELAEHYKEWSRAAVLWRRVAASTPFQSYKNKCLRRAGLAKHHALELIKKSAGGYGL